MNILHKTLIFGLSLGVIACSDDDPVEPETMPGEMIAATYNLGLAVGFVAASEERAPLTTTAVGELPADVLCVQEAWLPEHVDMLNAATSEQLPNATYIPADAGDVSNDATCMPGETDALQACVAMECGDVCVDQLVGCALANCNPEVQAIQTANPPCFTCIGANIGMSIAAIVDACENGSKEYLFGGSFGVGLLTNAEVLASDTLVLDSVLNRRGIIYNHLKTDIGEVHAFCTHLTATFSSIPYPGSDHADSYEEEQNLQLDAFHAFVDSKTSDGQVLLMGDMNNGPAGDGYMAEAGDNYTKLLKDGTYANPYIATPGHQCTFCKDNPIIAAEASADDTESAVIDHVLIGGFETGSAEAAAERIMTDAIMVDNCGETIDSALSDHYGVSITFTIK